MIQHEAILHIQRPVEQVFSFVTDSAKTKSWQEGLAEFEPVTRGPLRIGTQIREVRLSGGKKSERRVEVIALEPNKRFETRTTTKPLVTVSFAFAPDEGGTKVAYRYVMETAGTMKLLQGMLARGVKLQQDANLNRLKSELEK